MIKLSWAGIESDTTETCLLSETAQGVYVESTVCGPFGRCEYSLIADAGWLFRSLTVTVQDRSLRVHYDGTAWVVDGRARPDLETAREVDIAVTPLSNTLPIRRLELEVGQGVDITTAYVSVPELTVVSDPQRYTRLSSNEYRYESLDSDFTRIISVDQHGLVLRYPGLFVRNIQ